jgi:1-acyl-sn-glycerol-3-phosphate acyltransferase
MVRTILFFAWVWSSIALATPFALALGLLWLSGFRKTARTVTHAIARAWARSLIAFGGSRLEVEGADLVPDDPGLCYYANHQSSWDIMVLLVASPRPFGFVIKSSARFIPFVNLWSVLMGSVFIERGHPDRALATFDAAIREIAAGQAIAIFPEGRRSRSEAIGAFKKGAFKLATRAGATIVPVTISGTAAAWEAGRAIRPSAMRVRFHSPIRTEGIAAEERKSVPERVEAAIRSGANVKERGEVKA